MMDSRFLAFGDGTLYFNTGVNYQSYGNLNEMYFVEDGSGDTGMPPMSNATMPIVNDTNNNNNNGGDGDLNYGNDNDEQDVDGMAVIDERKVIKQFVIQPETVFVIGMSQTVSKHDIELLFSRAGPIRMDDVTGKPRIFAYKNKYTGQSRGEATVTYTNANAAYAAINWLNDSLFCGKKIRVLQAYVSYDGDSVRYDYIHERQPQVCHNRKKTWRPAADNWICTGCRNSNFSWRVLCNRCNGDRRHCELPKQNSPTRQWRQNKSNWHCSYCQATNFWHRKKCNRCQSPKDDNSDPEQRDEHSTVKYGNRD